MLWPVANASALICTVMRKRWHQYLQQKKIDWYRYMAADSCKQLTAVRSREQAGCNPRRVMALVTRLQR